MVEALIYSLCFGAAACTGVASYPAVAARLSAHLQRKTTQASAQLSDIFLNVSHRSLWVMYALSPAVVGGMAWMLTERWALGLVGFALGIVVPRIMLQQIQRMRQAKFQTQLVDSLLIMSSSLKAGLSMLQTFTVIAEEMPAPISQEFGLLLKQTRMGVNLDEAMANLKRRMPSDEVTLFTTAVLVARETGGDIAKIFTRLVETLRERKKIKEKIKTLTFMARMQGIIMGVLPFVFAYLVYQLNHDHFTFFLQDPVGKFLLAVVVAMQVLGFFLFLRFSRSPL